jgi:GDP-L-fucose synthase
MPTNLYGPHDNFDLQNSHVLPAMVRKFHEAKKIVKSRQQAIGTEYPAYSVMRTDAPPVVVLWGTGAPWREFLYVDDLADACVFLMERYDAKQIGEFVNVGTGSDLTIKELAEMIRKIVGFEGTVVWDKTKPDGTPRKLLDISRLKALGWEPKTALENGIRKTYEWYVASLRAGRL